MKRPISSILKRFLSKESNDSETVATDKPHPVSIAPSKATSGSIRITDQVIDEEVDENLTVFQATKPNRAAIKDIFQDSDHKRSHSSASKVSNLDEETLTGKLYCQKNTNKYNLKVISDEGNKSEDDFEKLRRTREKERQVRAQFKLTRSVSTQPSSSFDYEANSSKSFSPKDLFFEPSWNLRRSSSAEENRFF